MVLILPPSGSLLCFLFTLFGRVTEHRKYTICKMPHRFLLSVLVIGNGMVIGKDLYSMLYLFMCRVLILFEMKGVNSESEN